MPPPVIMPVFRRFAVSALPRVLVASLVVLLVAPVVLPQTPPEPEREQLLNGLRVLVWSQPGSPDLLVKLRVDSGAAFDLAGKSGQMALLGDRSEEHTSELQSRGLISY